MPREELAARIAEGRIVILHQAIDAVLVRRAREAIRAWSDPESDHDFAPNARSSHKRARQADGERAHDFHSFHFAIDNPQDAIGQAVRPVFDALARIWRLAAGDSQGADGIPLCAQALHYPAGCFYGWHRHSLEPLRIGLIMAGSERGRDFSCGGTEFQTPFGPVSIEEAHGLGSVCLFRYDLWHRVTPVGDTPNGVGRWSFFLTTR